MGSFLLLDVFSAVRKQLNKKKGEIQQGYILRKAEKIIQEQKQNSTPGKSCRRKIILNFSNKNCRIAEILNFQKHGMIHVQDTSYTWEWPIKDAKGKTRAAVPKRTHAIMVRVIATQTTSAKDTLSQKSSKHFLCWKLHF